jgi:serine/threonine-protein kinase RsbW
MKEVRQLTVLGQQGYGSIPVITQFVADAAIAAKLNEDAVFHCQMAVDEACTNVIEHAYGEDKAESFEVTCFVEPGRCTIQIIDHGKPFDPLLVPEPKISSNLDEIMPGGIGLHLMRQLMDEVQFEFLSNGNRLVMVKTSQVAAEPKPDLSIPVHVQKNGIRIVAPSGPLDANAAPALDNTLRQLISTECKWIIVDLAGVTYISSRGLKALVSGWRSTHDTSGNLVLCSVSPRVQGIIDTIGFNQVFDIYRSLEEATTALDKVVK